MRVCRVHELVQLASATLTGAHVTTNDSHREDTSCQDVSDNNELMPTSTEPNHVASRHSDGHSSANRDGIGLPSSQDDFVAPLKSSGIVTSSQTCTLPTCTDVLPSADSGLCSQETASTAFCTTEHQPALSVTILTSDGFAECATDTGNRQHVSSVSPANSTTVHLSPANPPTLPMSSSENASPVTSVSSFIDVGPTSATDTAASGDVGSQASGAVSGVSEVTVLAHSTLAESSQPCASSVLTELPDKLTSSAASEQLPGNTLSRSSPVVDQRTVRSKHSNHFTDAGTSSASIPSVTLKSSVQTVTATSDDTSAHTTNALGTLTSPVTQDKSQPSESAGDVQAASVSKKRRRDEFSDNEASRSAETEEKRTKYSKLDEAVVVSPVSATQPPDGRKDIASAVKTTGLTDVERVTCYKAIGAREERKRMIGLKAERLRRKRSLAEKATTVGDVDSSLTVSSSGLTNGKSPDELSSNGSSVTSSAKPARRVPLVTVSAKLPSTPTLFTLRARAKLAQSHRESGTPSIPGDGMESQLCIMQNGVQMRNSTEAAIDGECRQTTTADEVNSADLQESSSAFVVRRRFELAATETDQRQSSDEVLSNMLQSSRSDRRLRSAEKSNTDRTSPAAAAAVAVASSLETLKPGVAATSSADVNNKLTVSGKPSTPSSTSVIGKTNTIDITPSKRENENVADGVRQTAETGTGKGQSNVGTRPARKSGKSVSSETVTGGNVKNTPRNSLTVHETRSVKVERNKTSDATCTTEQSSPSDKNTCNTSEELKQLQPGSEDSMKLGHDSQKVSQKGAAPCAAAANNVNPVAKDVGNGKQNLERRPVQTGASHGASAQHVKKVKQPDVATAAQVLVALAALQPRNSADFPLLINKSASSVSPKRVVSQNTDIQRQKVARRKSTKTDLDPPILDTSTSEVSEKQARMKCEPATPRQQVDVSRDSDSAAKPSSPLNRASISRKESIDLFDVAIAGTPAHYACEEDSSDSLSLSPFNVDMVNGGVDSALEDVASANVVDFVIPDNPAADLVDTSLGGKYVVSINLFLTFPILILYNL